MRHDDHRAVTSRSPRRLDFDLASNPPAERSVTKHDGSTARQMSKKKVQLDSEVQALTLPSRRHAHVTRQAARMEQSSDSEDELLFSTQPCNRRQPSYVKHRQTWVASSSESEDRQIDKKGKIRSVVKAVPVAQESGHQGQIGRASCRERV